MTQNLQFVVTFLQGQNLNFGLKIKEWFRFKFNGLVTQNLQFVVTSYQEAKTIFYKTYTCIH
jgi:hypothetical protein